MQLLCDTLKPQGVAQKLPHTEIHTIIATILRETSLYAGASCPPRHQSIPHPDCVLRRDPAIVEHAHHLPGIPALIWSILWLIIALWVLATFLKSALRVTD